MIIAPTMSRIHETAVTGTTTTAMSSMAGKIRPNAAKLEDSKGLDKPGAGVLGPFPASVSRQSLLRYERLGCAPDEGNGGQQSRRDPQDGIHAFLLCLT